MTYSHLILSGDSPSTLKESIRISLSVSGIEKLIIVVPERSFTLKDVQKSLPQIWKAEQIEIKEAPINDVTQCALKILEILQMEKKLENETIINITNSMPVFMIAGYFCASASKSKIIMGLNEKAVEIPRVPFCKLRQARQDILSQIPDDENGLESQDKLVKKFENSPNKGFTKGNVSINLEDFETKKKYITRERIGKEWRIKLTDLGRLIKASHNLLQEDKRRGF